jgi:uncharacterized protein YjaG (DUF416 family)
LLRLISEETAANLRSLSAKKKLAFAVLLFERMVPELQSFIAAEHRNFSPFQRAREKFWRSLMDEGSSDEWPQLREAILEATPDSEDYGSIAASFALNAALVAANIAEFLTDGQDSHLVEAIGYARDSLDANATNEIGASVYNGAVENYVKAHPLVQKERQAEEDDVAFLSKLPDGPWPANIFSTLQHRADTQRGLLDKVFP